MTRRYLVALIVVGLGGCPLFAFDKPATGHFTLTFDERSPLSTNAEICARMGWALAAEEAAKSDYRIGEESFEVYVPATYTGEKPFGLLVFVSPGGGGSLKGYDGRMGWREVIDKHELIWVGPNKVGNDRFVRPRMGLAIDAAVNAQKRFKIDPNRVYIGGTSGGGRVASMLGVGFPDVFKGGFYIIGCNFYRREWSVEQKGWFRPSYYVPPVKHYVMAKKQSKHVFLTGDTDGNREQTEIYYKGFVKDGFEHCIYLQVPGMGHSPPGREWFAKGVEALDARVGDAQPAATQAATQAASRPVLVVRKAAAPTIQAPRTAATQPQRTAATQPQRTAEADADKLLAHAKLFVSNRLYDLAREKLRYIVQSHPDTAAAKEARKLLEELREK